MQSTIRYRCFVHTPLLRGPVRVDLRVDLRSVNRWIGDVEINRNFRVLKLKVLSAPTLNEGSIVQLRAGLY